MNIDNRKKYQNTVDYAQMNEITKENKTYMKLKWTNYRKDDRRYTAYGYGQRLKEKGSSK